MKNFTAKQKEIIARKLGYDGPMQGFDEFVQSSPALAMKYEMINDKYTERMNKGGAVMRYQDGGVVMPGMVDNKEQDAANASAKDADIVAKVRERFPDYNPNRMTMDFGPADQYYGELLRGGTADQGKKRITPANRQQETATSQSPVDRLSASFDQSVFSKTPQEKAAYYNLLLDSGYDDETIRTAIGAPQDQNWSALTNMASQQRAAAPSPAPAPTPVETLRSSFDQSVFSKTPQEKAAYYNSLLDAGYDDNTIREAIGAPLDQNWAQLRDIAQNLRTGASVGGGGGGTPATQSAVDRLRASFDQSIFNKTPAQKAEYYNSLLAAGYDDATIRAAINAPQDQNWSQLQRLAGLRKSFDTSIFNKTPQEKAAYYNSLLAAGYDDATIRGAIDAPLDANWSELQRIAAGLRTTPAPTPAPAPAPTPATQYGMGGRPLVGTTSQVTPAQTAITGEMKLDASKYALTTAAPQGTLTSATAAANIPTPTAVTGQSFTAATATPAVQEAMMGVVPATGTAQTIEAAQLTEQQKQAAMAQAQQLDRAQQAQLATRALQQGELVSGTAVDMARAEEAIAKTQAAQGRVTEDMTVQGQLVKLTANFDASNPPPWAAGAIRSVTAQLAARGLSASSMAGQAVVQAALEMAVPIASADAAAYQQMAAQNLSNRQQVAILSAQQRAQFLGQEFDQTFQTRVLNAAKIADIANMNFTAQQQVYLENARLAQSVDLANLNNRQATTIANAATLASMETTNLSARQQAAVANAQNFLQMEMANMSNTQQAALFKAQQLSQAALTDAAAENSARQFNATNKQQADLFNASLATQVAQFNNAQYNAIQQFNAGQSNAMSQFNAQMKAGREEFNARNRIIIDQANAQLIAQISTANTAATNAANFQNAQSMNNMTLSQYNNEVQLYRDQVKMVFDSYERAEDRAASMATAMLQAELAREKMSAEASAAYGKLLGSIVGTKVGEKVLDGAWDFVKGLFGG